MHTQAANATTLAHTLVHTHTRVHTHTHTTGAHIKILGSTDERTRIFFVFDHLTQSLVVSIFH